MLVMFYPTNTLQQYALIQRLQYIVCIRVHETIRIHVMSSLHHNIPVMDDVIDEVENVEFLIEIHSNRVQCPSKIYYTV